MFPLWQISVVVLLLDIGLRILLVVRDKQYIHTYVQDKGGHDISVRYQWLEGRHYVRVYYVTYLAATRQPFSTYCKSFGFGLYEPEIYWREEPPAQYELVPEHKNGNTGVNQKTKHYSGSPLIKHK